MNPQFQNTKYEIRNTKSERGFSLTEVLLAVGVLAVGMLFIAGVFPVSIHLITISSERTIAATVADEAFTKIKLYGLLPAADANWNVAGQYQHPFENVAVTQPPVDYFSYPSTPGAPNTKRYWWSVICRRVGPADVQVTVFVSRKAGAAKFNALNPLPPPTFITNADRPVAVPVQVSGIIGSYELTVMGNKTWINDGYTIVEDTSGQIYRVLERYPPPNDSVIRLDRPWLEGSKLVWVVPPPSSPGGGRYPCIAVYQKVVRF